MITIYYRRLIFLKFCQNEIIGFKHGFKQTKDKKKFNLKTSFLRS